MNYLRLIAVIFLLTTCNKTFSQEKYTILYDNDKYMVVDSLYFLGVHEPTFNSGLGGTLHPNGKLSIDSGLFSKIKVLRNGVENIETADSIKEIRISYRDRQFVYERVFNVKVNNEDYSANPIFLFRLEDGPIKLFQYEGRYSGYIAKEKNELTYFSYQNFNETCMVFFKNKPKIWKQIENMNLNDELDVNSLRNYIKYVNSPSRFKKQKGDFTNSKRMISEFIKNLKSSNEKDLIKFVDKVFFDKKSSDYFLAFNQFHYGMPAENESEYITFKNQYLTEILNFRRSLIETQRLSDIKLSNFNQGEIVCLNKSLDIYVSDVFFTISYGLNADDNKEISLGKILIIDGIMKTVSLPKL